MTTLGEGEGGDVRLRRSSKPTPLKLRRYHRCRRRRTARRHRPPHRCHRALCRPRRRLTPALPPLPPSPNSPATPPAPPLPPGVVPSSPAPRVEFAATGVACLPMSCRSDHCSQTRDAPAQIIDRVEFAATGVACLPMSCRSDHCSQTRDAPAQIIEADRHRPRRPSRRPTGGGQPPAVQASLAVGDGGKPIGIVRDAHLAVQLAVASHLQSRPASQSAMAATRRCRRRRRAADDRRCMPATPIPPPAVAAEPKNPALPPSPPRRRRPPLHAGNTDPAARRCRRAEEPTSFRSSTPSCWRVQMACSIASRTMEVAIVEATAAQDPASVGVGDKGHVGEPCPGRHIGEVCYPQHVFQVEYAFLLAGPDGLLDRVEDHGGGHRGSDPQPRILRA